MPDISISLNEGLTKSVVAEAQYACQSMASSWKSVLFRCFTLALKDTLVSKQRTIAKLSILLGSMGKRYCQDGLSAAAKDDYERLKDLVRLLPDRCRRAYAMFRQLTRQQQQDEIIGLILTWLIFWASAGGADLEGGLPDTDLAFGIEDHRNLFSHTMLLGMGAEVSMRFGLSLFGEICLRLPEGHSKAWDNAYERIEKHKNKSISAMWAGIGLHFLKDANLLSQATKPYVGLPHSMPMDFHQTLFAANGAASEAVAFAQSS